MPQKQPVRFRNEPLVIVVIAALIATALFTFEITTGLSASVRGTPIYNALPRTAAQRARLRARTTQPAGKAAADRAAARRARSASSASSASSVR